MSKRDIVGTAAVVLLSTLAFASNRLSAEELRLPGHPRLLLNADGVARLKMRVADKPWARQWWRQLTASLDAAFERPVELPPRGGNWYHWYVCPDDGTPLETTGQIGKWQWEHTCSLCSKVWTGGDPSKPSRDFDGCRIREAHFENADVVRNCGLAWQVTQRQAYLDRAGAILLAYADRYLSYPLHRNQGDSGVGGGRVASQTLTEASWLVTITQGADLVWSGLSEADREAIADKLLLPAARDVILPHRMGIHNIQCWKNSAVGLVGFLLGDEELIREAIDNPDRGYRVQMEQGVTPDGSWYEGAWGYHFYTLRGTTPLTEAAANCGLDLYGQPIRSMFDAPIRLMSPTGMLPAFNDSNSVSVEGQAPLYELAYARFRNPDYLAILAHSQRDETAALWGVDELPAAADLPTRRSADYRQAGVAILTSGKGRDATWLCLDYGPHGGGHGHPDKLGFVLYARGEELAVDPGTARYGTPLQGSWFRTTLAHNTLTAGEASQKPATGRCRAFGSSGGVDYLVADAGEAYPDVSFTRGVAMLDENTVVLVDRIDAKRPTTLDVPYHQRGAWGELPPGNDWQPPEKSGYRHLTDAKVHACDRLLRLPIAGERTPQAAVVLAAGPPTGVITAMGIGHGLGDRVPTVIFRREGTSSLLVWALSLDGKLQDLSAKAEDQGVLVNVTTADGNARTLRWNLSSDLAGLDVD